MREAFKRAAILLFAVTGVAAAPGVRQPPDPATPATVRAVLHARIPASGAAPRLVLEGEAFRASPALACFYQRRDFAPAWSAGNAGELFAALAAAPDDGLRTEDYRLAALQRLAAAVRDPSENADLDLLLSDAFLTFAGHLRNGKVNPAALYPDCALGRDATDLATVLEEGLRANRVRAALAALAPPGQGYQQLRAALGRYRRLAAQAGAAPVAAGRTLRPGDRGERVAALRARLAEAAAADNAPPVAPPASAAGAAADLFDAPLADALRAFEARHGLDEDGAAGRGVLAAVNLSAADRVRQIEVNLERWRWLPHDLDALDPSAGTQSGARRSHVLVNIAAFRLEAVEEGRTVLAMRVIVGKPYTRTPMFSSAMTAVVLNPSWYVPRKIAVQELLPKAAKDPSYLRREGYEVLPGSRLRQKPGPNNALGRIKLLFPNRFDVYLHDTSAPALFGRALRTFSHGCIRIEKPLELAAWALRDAPRWTPEALRAAIDTGRERSVPLPGKIPVHVAYWTAWVGDDGALRLSRDVYQRDAQLARLLAGGGPKEAR
jgi:murein L,D-transpeptidase YcbB/YkuD